VPAAGRALIMHTHALVKVSLHLVLYPHVAANNEIVYEYTHLLGTPRACCLREPSDVPVGPGFPVRQDREGVPIPTRCL
jgi:hypothetical protein